MNGHRARYRSAALAAVEALKSLCLLVIGELGFSTELHASRPGNLTSIVGPLDDALALILGRRRQKGDE